MKRLSRYSLVLTVMLFASWAQAEAVKQYSVADFFKNSEFSRRCGFRQDGEWLAAIGPYEGRRNLFAMRLSDRKVRSADEPQKHGQGARYNKDIAFFFWANDERLIFGMDADGNESFSMFAVNSDGTRQRQLFKGDRGIVLFSTYTRPLDLLEDDPEHILVTNNRTQQVLSRCVPHERL